jgi:hypothetical protein
MEKSGADQENLQPWHERKTLEKNEYLAGSRRLAVACKDRE